MSKIGFSKKRIVIPYGNKIKEEIKAKIAEIVDIKDLIPNPKNKTLYPHLYGYEEGEIPQMGDGKDKMLPEKVKDLVLGFKDKYLNKSLEVYDNDVIKAGHNRTSAAILSGYTHIPIRRVGPQPKSELEEMEEMVEDNRRPQEDAAEKCRTAHAMIEAWEKQNNKDASDEIKEKYCVKAGANFKSYKEFQILKIKRPDLYKRVTLDGDKLSLTRAVKMMKEDENPKNIKVFPSSPAFENFLEKEWILRAIDPTQKTMIDQSEYNIKIGEDIINPFQDVERTVISHNIHEVFGKFLAAVINNNSKYKARHLEKQQPMDLTLEGIDFNIDHKVSFHGKDWKSNYKIEGDVIFISYNADFKRWFIAYGHTKAEDWEPNKNKFGGFNYPLKTLYQKRDNFKFFIGDISIDEKGKCIINKDKNPLSLF